ncbi:MAG: Eco57I restriction-modification methylase domain-containing protein [Terriglobia bacterium]
MPKSPFEEAFERVNRLVETFRASEARYLSPDYQEAEARKDFIDKFFIALGWDVNHDQQTNPYEQEVKVEPSVQAGGQRRADYAFHLAPSYRDVRFFVEAKKPYAEIATAENYFQTIRYGWNSETPLAVLTDFEQFHVLDCRYKPDLGAALQRNVAKYHYSEYADRKKFSEIYWLFSREAVADGSLEKRASELPKPRGRAVRHGLFPGAYQGIDEAFLKELDEYRADLARTFKAKNPRLDSETLTELAQRTLDRLVFVRFLEDKAIEPQRIVDRFGDKGTAWEDFVAASRRLDGIYNGIVFKHHGILDGDKFRVDDGAFADICKNLAHINSPYDFNYIPIHILGSIYERFLGNVIVVTDKRVCVEPKPEVRKAGGVYYTPEYIVRYIVENTVGKLIARKTPDQIAGMRFADIACGSGSFLLGVFDLLLTYYGQYYNDNPSKARKGDCVNHGGRLYLSLGKKREILLNNIYGVDIDPQAVEVCQLSLYLRLLQEETEASTQQYLLDFMHIAQMKRLLPDLSKNIVCGNSLIGRDIGSGLFNEQERKLNPMNFEDAFPEVTKRGGFDAIVGNPPYDVMEKERGASSWPHTALSGYVRVREDYKAALGGKLNLFRFFIVQSLALLREEGRLGMIVPLALIADISCTRTRQHMLLSTSDLVADCFPQKDDPKRRVFLTAKLSTVVVTGSKAKADSARVHVRVYPGNSFSDPYRECFVRLSDTKLLDPQNTPVPLVDSEAWDLCRKIHSARRVSRLGQAGEFSVTRGEINQTIYRRYITTDAGMARLLKGVEIGRYELHRKLQQGHREWFDESRFLRHESPKPVVRQRRIATQRITGVDERLRVVATIIDPPAYFADSTNSITVSSASLYALEYLLGLLNSRLTQWRFKITSTNNNVGTNELESLPFRKISFADACDKALHDEMVTKVDSILKAKKDLTKAKSDKDKTYYENKCAALDRQIDGLVYGLYGLTKEEIEIVEKER